MWSVLLDNCVATTETCTEVHRAFSPTVDIKARILGGGSLVLQLSTREIAVATSTILALKVFQAPDGTPASAALPLEHLSPWDIVMHGTVVEVDSGGRGITLSADGIPVVVTLGANTEATLALDVARPLARVAILVAVNP